MNRDELIELKNEILSSKKKYVPLWIGDYNCKIVGEPMTLEEIQSKANTADVVKQYENAIESSVRDLLTDGEDVTSIRLFGSSIIFCEERIAKELVSFSEKMYKDFENEQEDSLKAQNMHYYEAASMMKEHEITRESNKNYIREYIKEHFSGNILSDYAMVLDRPVGGSYSTSEYSDCDTIDSEIGVMGIINLNEMEVLVENLGFDYKCKMPKKNIDADFVYKLFKDEIDNMYYIGVDLTNQKSK